ncbi:hypothetical protein CYY_006954 [Polysphondylium violaceum]|uniref:Uncharacterized protein n=1 Tax=Polysphondylium violaceum TaxID=133409 RepID=A0A8J4UXY6_9MYCE|nr:hypothetical protein CYY_006954 [Polysphondylium violaceum]
MKVIFALVAILALVASASAKTSYRSTPADIVSFIVGVADGLEISMNENATQCVTESGATFDEFVTAFHLIDQGFQKKSVALVGQGIEDFGLALQEVPVAFQTCGVEKFVQEIESLAKQLSSGTDGIIEIILKEALNIFHNRVDLSGEFKAAIADWKSGSFFGCGQNVGEIVGILLTA